MAITQDASHPAASTVSVFDDVSAPTELDGEVLYFQPEATSTFPNSNLPSPTVVTLSEIQVELQKSFISTLSKRLSYLDGLRTLKPGWITGGGEAPEASTITIAKRLLQHIENQARFFPLDVIPRLVIGPIPSGGVTIEFHAEEDSALYVTIDNDKNVEIDVKYRGAFSSMASGAENLGTRVLSRYGSITE